MPIYTKTGDRGKTSLGSGKRVWKNDVRVNTYGTIDELNSLLGISRAELNTKKTAWRKKLDKLLEEIQLDLFDVGSYLANVENEWLLERLFEHTSQFEKSIDDMTAQLPPRFHFILPGGGKLGASLHHARTVARRAERAIITLIQQEEVDERVVKYVNRLSDLLFTMARFSNIKEKHKEIIWSR
jgi:cob(I)alamin adenosyltransferase